MNKKAIQISLVFVGGLILAAIAIISMLAFSSRTQNDESIYHIYAAKTASLNIDALSSISGNAMLGQLYPIEYSFLTSSAYPQMLIIRDKNGEVFEKRTPIILQHNQELKIDQGSNKQWYFSKINNVITIAKEPPKRVPTKVCLASTHQIVAIRIQPDQQNKEYISILGELTNIRVTSGEAQDATVVISIQEQEENTIKIITSENTHNIGCDLFNSLNGEVQVIPISYPAKDPRQLTIKANVEQLSDPEVIGTIKEVLQAYVGS